MNAKKRDFDKEAAVWDDNPVRVKLADDLFAAMEKQVAFDPSMSVLDFGCGTGLVTLRIAPRVGSITGADSSQGMLDVLRAKSDRKNLRNVRTLFLDSGDTSLLSGRYDVIVIGMALHHIEAIHPLLNRFHECLAEGSLYRRSGSRRRTVPRGQYRGVSLRFRPEGTAPGAGGCGLREYRRCHRRGSDETRRRWAAEAVHGVPDERKEGGIVGKGSP